MNLLRVISIQRGAVYDGPGIRTTVFLKGCTLHCPWCCNPEAISENNDYFIDQSKCLISKNIESKICVPCERKLGSRSLMECPYNVMEPTCRLYSVEELLFEVLKDKTLYEQSEGGVTISGGEPFLQSLKLLPLLQKMKDNGINIWVETSLWLKCMEWISLLSLIDGVYIDLKLQEENNFLENMDYIEKLKNGIKQIKQAGVQIIYRLVFVYSVLKNRKVVVRHLHDLGVMEIELLKCHNLGAKKYEKLNIPYMDFTPEEKHLRQFSEYLNSNNIKNSVLKV